MDETLGPNQCAAAPASSHVTQTRTVRPFGLSFAIVALACLIALTGCVKEPQPRATVLRELDSGYTSSSGGGQSYLGGQIDETITTRVQ